MTRFAGALLGDEWQRLIYAIAINSAAIILVVPIPPYQQQSNMLKATKPIELYHLVAMHRVRLLDEMAAPYCYGPTTDASGGFEYHWCAKPYIMRYLNPFAASVLTTRRRQIKRHCLYFYLPGTVSQVSLGVPSFNFNTNTIITTAG